jgi:signal transduction histidine kinase
LADALGDPALQLRYPLPGSAELVDPDGRPASSPEAAVTPIVNDGRVVALAVHSADVSDEPVTRDLGAAVRLAAANESLLAAVRHEILELRASRARIVAAGDAERQRLERDLHDGAQQRLLAVLYELSIARDLAQRDGTRDAGARLARASDDADAATEALRRLARGIHQAVITQSGLMAALDALAIEAPIPVTIDVPADLACGPETEMTAWRVLEDTVGQAIHLGATGLAARVSAVRSRLLIDVTVEGLSGEPDLLGVADRIGAGGGRLTVAPSASGKLSFAMDLPCG